MQASNQKSLVPKGCYHGNLAADFSSELKELLAWAKEELSSDLLLQESKSDLVVSIKVYVTIPTELECPS